MNNYITMTADFERQKNIKASAITFGTAGLLLLIIVLIKFPVEADETVFPPVEELMEVNLGAGDVGSGKDQPLLPGEPAPAQQVAYTPPSTVQSTVDNAKDVETDDRSDNDAPVVRKPTVASRTAAKIDNDNKVVKTTPTPAPVVAPAPPQPKATMGRTTGGNGNGGNGADTYKPGTGEGIAGGTGDQGRPGGDPNGRTYTGTPKNFGVKVLNLPAQSFEDEFNENAKVAMDVVANDAGKVTSATYQPRGSTTSNRQMIDIAKRRAFELKLGSSDGGQKGTVIFNFKLKS
jgi:hypothetical protein